MKTTLFPLLLGFVFASCAPSTPQARIDRQPEKFASLSKKDQDLVQQGLINKGMPPAAVELAWGRPDRIFEGSKNQQASARWDYTGTLPVYSSSIYGGYGYGYGPYYGRGRYGNYGYGFRPEVAYIPYRMASVWFINDRVDAWERAR
ncbi:MAG: hypothetical protein WEB53_03220 [Akkermansiaceae bacterium]